MKSKPLHQIFSAHRSNAVLLLFITIILIGAVLLNLPIATRDGTSIGFLDALFTSTSATCVTGLIVVDTYSYWSTFGQVVILALIQIGGLGLMMIATMFSLIIRRNISYNERMLLREQLNAPETKGAVRLAKHILYGTFCIEFVGALLLSIRFIPQFGLKMGIFKSVFHSVSAFCNAGFDLMGDIQPYGSLTYYASDVLVNFVIMILIILGGIGFVVWADVVQNYKTKRFTLHTKIVLIMTTVLLVVGFISFFALEYDNPATMKDMNIGEKAMSSLFQSVTTRTAGFNTIDQVGMTDSSKFISVLLMFVGGSPGSTAGGIKVVTLFVILLSSITVARGRNQSVVFGRRISQGSIMRAVAITVLALMLVALGSIILSTRGDFDFIDTLFEVTSAFGTVGLSANITGQVDILGKITLILLMFFGKIGVLSATFSFISGMHNELPERIKYPEGKIMVG